MRKASSLGLSPFLLVMALGVALLSASFARAQNCYNSNDDENIIEYFNLINYMGDFTIRIESTSNDSYDVSVICPKKQSTDMPPEDFNLEIRTIVGNLSTACYSNTPLTISKTNQNCNSNGQCSFIVVCNNKQSDKVYSQTEIKLALKTGLEENPELNPASLPICLDSVVPCLKSDDCSLVDDSLSSFDLAENQKADYNEMVNFKINLDDN